MKRVLIASAIAIASLGQAVAPAAAQTAGPTPKELLLDLQRVTGKPTSPPVAPITRSAAVRVTGTIEIVGSIQLPLYCSVSFYSYNSGAQGYSESKTLPATVNGSTGTCSVYVPFRWSNIDPSTQMEVSVDVSSSLAQAVDAVAVATLPVRTSAMSFGTLPLPAENTVTALTFAIKM